MQIKDISKDEPLIISYCDFFVEWNYNEFIIQFLIMTWSFLHLKGLIQHLWKTTYAYTKIDDNNELIELKEKESFTSNRINEYANQAYII